jgi:predicted nucleotidyltransferase component of viral defense system
VVSTRQVLGWIGISRDIKYPANTFLLKWEDRSFLKLDFNYYAFKQFKKGPKILGLSVDSLEDLAANKFDTILTRRQARDYVDLYTIVEKSDLTLKKIIGFHQRKFEMKVDYLAIAKSFLLVSEARDYPLMRTKFDRKKMIAFFENEARNLTPQIFTA